MKQDEITESNLTGEFDYPTDVHRTFRLGTGQNTECRIEQCRLVGHRRQSEEYPRIHRAYAHERPTAKGRAHGICHGIKRRRCRKILAIYSQYDADLTKLNDQRVANIEEYARTYNQMTDEKADELIQNSFTYQRQRAELLAKTYERVKEAVGATTATRFVQVEHQLLLIIDLQIASSLPVVGQGS